MDEQNSGAAPVESIPLPIPYKDRSVGLTVFGVLTLLLGCLAGLFILMMLFGHAAAARTTGASAPLSTVLPGVFIYGILAVALVWLGIGSVMARRWARALLLIFSWSWLIIGLIMVVFMAFFVPKMMATLSASGTPGHPGVPSGTMGAIMVFMMMFFVVFFVILPAVWVFFYNSRHVKATCAARDPIERWTDACPLPVLGFCLWLAISVPMLLVMPLTGHAVMPFFGFFLTGVPGSLFCLAIAAIWGYATWSLYKLEQRGWWVILIAMCLFMISTLITYSQHDFLDTYRLMGYPQAQIDQIQKTGLLSGHWMTWLMAFSLVPFVGYLLFIKRYFRKA